MRDNPTNGHINNLSSDKLQLNSYIERYRRYKYFFVISLLLCLLGAALFLWITTPLYRIQATLVIKDEKKGEAASPILKELDFLDEQKIVDNEAEIVKSASVIGKVVTDLRLVTSYYHKKNLFRNIPLFYNIPVQLNCRSKNGIESPVAIEIKLLDENGFLFNDKRYGFGETIDENGLVFFVTKTQDFDATKHRNLKIVLQSEPQVIQQIKKGISVSTPTKNSSVLNISMLHPSPEKGMLILRKIIEQYNLSNIQDKQIQTDTILRLIEERLALISNQLGEYETKEQKYKVQNRITNISEDAKLYLDQAKEIDREMYEAEIELDRLTRLEKFTGNISASLNPPMAGIEDPVLLSLLQQLGELKLENENLLRTMGPENPLVIANNQQIEEVLGKIVRNVELQKQNLNKSLQFLRQNKERIDRKIGSVPGSERNLLQIIREKNIRESIYTFLLQKREEASIANASAFSKMRVIDYPYSSAAPVKPNKLVLLGAALLIGILAPASFINLKRELNNRVNSLQTIQEKLPGVAVAEIARMKKFNSIASPGVQLFIPEQFRKLRTQLLKQTGAIAGKTFLITSSVHGEGKSFTGVNLAISFAWAGKKTILLDFGSGNSRLLGILPFPKQSEFSASLPGNANNISSLTHAISDIPNLYFLRLDKATTHELTEEAMDRAFHYLKQEYDVVIILTPPYRIFNDALQLEKYSDVNLFLFRHDYTHRRYLDQLSTSIEQLEFKNPILVYNDVPLHELFEKEVYSSKAFKNINHIP